MSDGSVKSSQRQFLVKVEGIPGNMAGKSGGNISADTNKVYDGGDPDPDVMAGPASIDDVTVTRAFAIDRDSGVLEQLRQKVGRWKTTVSVTPLNIDLIPAAKPTVYLGLLSGLNEPEADASSSDSATYELVFTISKVA